MTKLQAIREFTKMVLNDTVTIARDKFSDGNWAMDISDRNPRLKLPYDLNLLHDRDDKIFRKDFVDRCPMARGFASVTLTLLHECGHWATRDVMDIVEYDKLANLAYTQEIYMAIPWEMLATQWAICWLHSPINRKIAKDFEKKYFGRV